MIRRLAFQAFCHHNPAQRRELIQEVIANAYTAFARLVAQGKADIAYPTPLARFAIQQVCGGRRVGTPVNRRDVCSPANRHVVVESLCRYDVPADAWREVLVEDRHAGPAETAAARLDIAAWLAELPSSQRRIAQTLSTGETTKRTAQQHRVSPGRNSQLRRELQASWQAFQAEAVMP
jgi:hypothetical protein